MASVEFKLEKDLCRCCHCVGSFKNLAEPFKTAVSEEIYWDMLKECFNIDMSPVPDMLNASTNAICDACIIRLQDAADFKKQVLLCEERFKDIYRKNSLKGNITTIEIKEEPNEELPESDDDFMNPLPQESDDDGFDVAVDMKIIDEEKADEKPANVEVRKKRTCTQKIVKSEPVKSKVVKSKVVKSKAVKSKGVKSKAVKRKAVKSKAVKSNAAQENNLKEEPADQSEAVTKPGPLAPKFELKEGVDYKIEGNKYICSRCSFACRWKNTLKKHVKKKHDFKCPICNDDFKTMSSLVDHKLKTHNVDLRVTCNICDRIFNTQTLLNRHVKNVHMQGETGKRYKCEHCDFVTIKSKSLYAHKFLHKSEKDMKCKYCEKSFKRRNTLVFHERIHTGDRRKVCTVCQQAFVQKASLNYHMMKHHPGVKF